MIPDQLAKMLSGYALFDAALLPVAAIVLYFLRNRGLGNLTTRSPLNTSIWRQSLLGLSCAVGSLALIIMPAWILGAYSPNAMGFCGFRYLIADPQPESWLFLSGLLFFQSLFEELLFRCVGVATLAWLLYWLSMMLLNQDADTGATTGNWRTWFWCGLAANLIVAGAFAYAHSSNAGASPLGLTNIMLAGLVLGQLFVNSVNVFAPWLFHFGWNMGLSLLGLPVSGYALSPAASAIGFSGAVDGFVSGGQFGPEGSALSTVVLIWLAGWLIYSGLNHPAGTRAPDPQPTG